MFKPKIVLSWGGLNFDPTHTQENADLNFARSSNMTADHNRNLSKTLYISEYNMEKKGVDILKCRTK
jgi:hypothetical protein